MTQYIDKADADAIKGKVERRMRERAEAAVVATAPVLFGKGEDEARAVLDEMVKRLAHELDEVERELLRDLDASWLMMYGPVAAGHSRLSK